MPQPGLDRVKQFLGYLIRNQTAVKHRRNYKELLLIFAVDLKVVNFQTMLAVEALSKNSRPFLDVKTVTYYPITLLITIHLPLLSET